MWQNYYSVLTSMRQSYDSVPHLHEVELLQCAHLHETELMGPHLHEAELPQCGHLHEIELLQCASPPCGRTTSVSSVPHLHGGNVPRIHKRLWSVASVQSIADNALPLQWQPNIPGHINKIKNFERTKIKFHIFVL